ncbi:MAG TPA: sulfite exporter TauE/SafE family protein [Micromonosporaceae bacterium]|nr:sulfite exporter TauE/SafE family protein [Micromonosporaceae bacterium]
MELTDAALLLAAGLGAGTVNAVAGGGSLVTFPTLVAVGLPPISASVTNSVSVCPGYLASVVGSRKDLEGQGQRLRRLAPTVVAGTAAGCALLLATPQETFELVVPFLVLGATLVLAIQDRLRRVVGNPVHGSPRRAQIALHSLVFLGAVYGGYFNAALGVMLVAVLGLVIDDTLRRVSALKNAVSAVIGVGSVLAYAAFGPVNWAAVAVLAPATLLGGYSGASIARRVPQAVLRVVIVAFGTIVGVVLLLRALQN